MRKGKRLEIYLPAKHTIFSTPKGQRSQRVRDALDLADRLESIITSLDDRLASLDARLAHIETALTSDVVQLIKKEEQPEEQETEFDIDAFMKI